MGPIRAWLNDTELVLGSPQQRALLALLLIRASQAVPLSEISNFLWRDGPPASAANVVHHHVSALRRLLEPDLGPRNSSSWLRRDGSGYRLAVEPDRVDLHVFRARVEHARACAANENWRQAASSYLDALALRQGPVGTGSPHNVIDSAHFTEVEIDYGKAVVEAVEVHLRIGDAQRVVTLVRQTADRFPWDERLQAAYIRTLGATGRQADALAVYRTLHGRLADELGIEPGPALRAAQTAVLRQNTQPAETAPLPGPSTRPAQLPPDLPVFAGREAGLTRILTAAARTAGPVVAPISGMAGIGKTALAVHAARRIADRFPDGQLFLNLHGFDDVEPMSPTEALRHLLESLGQPAAQLPAGLPGLMGLYRSRLAGLRVIVVLDNALDAQQVRPLLPATPGCMAIVTSRNVLAGLLITNHTEPVRLAEMTTEESFALLERHLGAARAADERAAVEDVVDVCAGLPIALASVAARAALTPHKSLAEIAAELRSADNGLDAFCATDPDMDIRRLLARSYRRLDQDTARLFRRLALRPASFPVDAAAALADVPVSRCRQLLANLVAVCLLTESAGGGFRIHDFVADFAREALHDADPPAERAAAVARVLNRYRPEDLRSVSSSVGHGIGAQPNADWPRPLDSSSVRSN
ncbi:BTAD domain-containing putative transcriptional regulator [Kutzneria sp. NPDC052558]|uniref:AfsR/SARP family transcriptional regulator n=1 Tax=Kutzneria sp. NPDC052558 TaxID=3364121 RepID=UPI0037C6817B